MVAADGRVVRSDRAVGSVDVAEAGLIPMIIAVADNATAVAVKRRLTSSSRKDRPRPPRIFATS
jgi:hypothetical protein